LVNYSVTYISDIETGRTTPSVKTLIILAKALDVGVSVLFNENCCYMNIAQGKGCQYNNDYERCYKCPLYSIESEEC